MRCRLQTEGGTNKSSRKVHGKTPKIEKKKKTKLHFYEQKLEASFRYCEPQRRRSVLVVNTVISPRNFNIQLWTCPWIDVVGEDVRLMN